MIHEQRERLIGEREANGFRDIDIYCLIIGPVIIFPCRSIYTMQVHVGTERTTLHYT